MISIPKLPTDTLIFAIIGLFLSFILVWPASYGPKTLPNYAFNTRIFTNIAVGGDVINPPIVTPIDEPINPIVAPIPAITPAPTQVFPTNVATNFSTNFPVTNSITNTNN
jgi:hypothetical protein